MRWNFAAAACGLWMATLGSGEVFADGDAEAPPSPGRLGKPPATAEVSDRAESPAPPVPPAPSASPAPMVGQPRVQAARLDPVGPAKPAAVKTMLPADYRPYGEAHGGSPGKDAAVPHPHHSASRDSLGRKRIPLAPSAAELRREIALRDGGPTTPPADGKSTAERMQDKATQVPNQRRAWPTTVTNTAGPTSPAGPGSAQDRKGTVIEASGPQQGVIRNRW